MKDSLMRPVARAGASRRRSAASSSTRLLSSAASPGLSPSGELSLHFEGLANPTRLKIVESLAVSPREVTVSELAEQCRVSQPRMSWHLRILKRAQVIRTRRDGREVLCRLDRDSINRHLERFAQLLGELQPISEVTP
ncbi:MAG TPA: metalloregulator ArsR/SmtB family transcription factor [Candidatus Sulfotelmatobacter sp.]|nr:metalloregulator ArsR/SmtB family transcription factor [Candidatus Sulfotelmatobacter sp.]